MSTVKNEKTENHQDRQDTTGTQKRMTSRRIAALAGIVLLAAMYIVTLIIACVDTDSSGRMFALSLSATIAVPLLIWIYTWMYGKLTNKHTFADLDLMQDPRDKYLRDQYPKDPDPGP